MWSYEIQISRIKWKIALGRHSQMLSTIDVSMWACGNVTELKDTTTELPTELCLKQRNQRVGFKYLVAMAGEGSV